MVRSKIVLLIIAAMCMSCGDGEYSYDQNRTLSDFSEYIDKSLQISPEKVTARINSMVAADNGGLQADKHTRSLYNGSQQLRWITKGGLDASADTLVEWLQEAETAGTSPRVFRLEEIRRDIKAFCELDFANEDISTVTARLDYNLTRAYLRYVAGQKYGFVSPEAILNRLYEKEPDSTSRTKRYFRLFDIPVKRADDEFFAKAVRMVGTDSMNLFLHEVQPVGTLYKKLVEKLAATTDGEVRQKIICNIERCRWRQVDYPEQHEKYVQVNIPSFSLRAVDGEKTLNMRIGCGAVKTKTPLLTSRIIRMEMNPQWIVPKSIAKGIAYSYNYLRKENMFIFDKKLGKLPYTESNLQKILSGEQYIVQKGGAGNSLGRIIFRFPNNFSVYMHDTNTPWQLQRENRAISHGCVRLERPFDLAVFLLKNKDQSKIDRIRELTTKDSVMRSMEIEPNVPVYINYYTYYPNDSGVLQSYPDVYGYDKAIMERLNAFIRKE